MKKLVLLVWILAICLPVVLPGRSSAEDVVLQPPPNLESLIGRIIVFTDDSNTGNKWYASITGVSSHVMGRGKAVVVYVAPINYNGYAVKQIVFNANFAAEWWQLEYYMPIAHEDKQSRNAGDVTEKGQKIKVLSF